MIGHWMTLWLEAHDLPHPDWAFLYAACGPGPILKVGQTINPKKREAALPPGFQIDRFAAVPRANLQVAEAQLIRLMGEPVRGREWFDLTQERWHLIKGLGFHDCWDFELMLCETNG